MKAIIFGIATIAWLLAFWIPLPPFEVNYPVVLAIYILGFIILGNFFLKYAFGWGEK
jgi:hypothetical protein